MKIVQRAHLNCFVQTQHIEISLFEIWSNTTTFHILHIINHIQRVSIFFLVSNRDDNNVDANTQLLCCLEANTFKYLHTYIEVYSNTYLALDFY